METIDAKVSEVNQRKFIEIALENDVEPIRIPLTEDNPNAVKDAFNLLIVRLKKGEFELRMDDIGDDLFSQVASEYIAQLNRELKEVYGEMKEFGLIES
ncbi:MAG: hypothetical protein NXI22_17465 [bacterium]|nr:hypothetical protein [bacterium]